MSIEIDRTRKEYKLLSGDINYVNLISKKHNLQPSDALSKIISEHRDNSKMLETTLKEILIGMKNLNKLSEIQLEIINSICMKENYQEKDFVSKSEFTCELVSKAYEKVEKEIINNNIKKFNN